MFGMKIRSWMEAHIARSRSKKKEKKIQVLHRRDLQDDEDDEDDEKQREEQQASSSMPGFHAKIYGRNDFNEGRPSLSISSSSSTTSRSRHLSTEQCASTCSSSGYTSAVVESNLHHHHHHQHAVNLSSPESAYSTGYSTDGTSPGACYTPESYAQHARNGKQFIQHATRIRQRNSQEQQQQQTDATNPGRSKGHFGANGTTNTNTYVKSSVSPSTSIPVSCQKPRNYIPTNVEQQQQQQQQQHYQWTKPSPPQATNSIQRIGSAHVTRKPYNPIISSPVHQYRQELASTNNCLYLVSPRKLPNFTSNTQRQRSRLKSNPWIGNSSFQRQQQQNHVRNNSLVNGNFSNYGQYHQIRNGTRYERCCAGRQESLSVGTSPVNRSSTDWRSPILSNSQQISSRSALNPSTVNAVSNNNNNSNSNNGNLSSSSSSSSSRKTTSSSSSSSKPTCSTSSSSSSSTSSSRRSSNGSIDSCCSNASNESSSDDDVTLNELIGTFDEGYTPDKETDIVSDNNVIDNTTDDDLDDDFDDEGNGSDNDFSSDYEFGRRFFDEISGRQRKKTTRRYDAHEVKDVGGRKREYEDTTAKRLIGSYRYTSNNSDKREAMAKKNRVLLERLLLKNNENRRAAWSAANPEGIRSLISRSAGGTPICNRRKIPDNQIQTNCSPFRSKHQLLYPLENYDARKNMSATELAMIEADKEADRKYEELIMEAERMLIDVQYQMRLDNEINNSARGSSTSVTTSSMMDSSSPSHYPYNRQYYHSATAPNKRVESIKNAELNVELALSKSRNSHPELASGSIKDLLDHLSPKRMLLMKNRQLNGNARDVVNRSFNKSPVVNSLSPRRTLNGNFMPVFQKNGFYSSQEASDDFYSCPQSEPVKRKVYESNLREDNNCNFGTNKAGILRHHQYPPWLRNSVGDCASTDQYSCNERSSSSNSSYSQARRQILYQTLQELKQSLQDQSATLKMNCLQSM